MKKKALPLLGVILLLAFSLSLYAQFTPVLYLGYPIVRLFVNEKELVSADMYAVIINGRTMVPLRLVAEALEAEVEYDQANNRVLITNQVPEAERYIAPPKKELITISDLSYRTYHENLTQIMGKVKNDNKDYVDIEIAVYYYDDRGIIDHIHISIDSLGPEDTREFYTEAKKDVSRYTRMETIIYQLTWD